MRTLGSIISRGLLLASLLLLISGRPIAAQVQFAPQPESTFWIEGTSTLNDFTCEVEEIDGYGLLDETTGIACEEDTTSEPTRARVEVVVPVRRFDCGKKRMNNDLYDAMKADTFPQIHFELEEADVLTTPEHANDWYQLRATGRLRIAGDERTIEVLTWGQYLGDGRVRVRGHKDLLMSDFGVDPPQALWGLVKAHDHITVHFDLIAAAQNQQKLADARAGQDCGDNALIAN